MKKVIILAVVSMSFLLGRPSFLRAEEIVTLSDDGKEDVKKEKKKKPSVEELKEKMPYHRERGVYIDNGYAFGINLLSEDRDAIRDSLWIDGRLGYQFHRNVGIHLDTGYFISSLKGLGRTINAGYFRIGPGIKIILPIADTHFAGFVGTMVGYGRASASDPIFGTSISKGGLALGMDAGITGKVTPWLGFSPYIGLHDFFGSIDGQNVRSHWFTAGLMINLCF